MMEKASDKAVYSNLVEFDLNLIDEFPRELQNTFDIVVCAGLVNNNHMDECLFEAMMMAAKKSALIIFASRFSYIGEYWYNDVLVGLEK